MKRIFLLLTILILGGCVSTSIKPPQADKITAFYTRSSTVTVVGERGAVEGKAEVIIRDPAGVVAARVKADRKGSFNIDFCAGQWAREHLNCKYKGDLRPGDRIRIEYIFDSIKSPPVLILIR